MHFFKFLIVENYVIVHQQFRQMFNTQPGNNMFAKLQTPQPATNNLFVPQNKPNTFGGYKSPGGGIFAQPSNNPPGVGQNVGGNNFFGQPQPQQQNTNNLFNRNPMGAGFLNQNPPQPVGGGNLINQTNTPQPGNNLFNIGNTPQTGGGLFNPQPAQTGGLFNPQPAQTGGLFNPQPAQTGGLFNPQTPQTGGGLFNPQPAQTGGGLFNPGNTPLLNQNTMPSMQTGGLFNPQPSNPVGGGLNTAFQAGNLINQNNRLPSDSKIFELMNAPLDQQKQLIEAFSPDYVQQLLSYYRKSADTQKIERLQLTLDNPLRSEKITRVVNALPPQFKAFILQVQRLIRDNVTLKVKKLKDDKQKLDALSANFSRNVFQKLQKYKEKLIIAVAQTKMIEEVKKEVGQIDKEIQEFFKPLFNAQQNKTSFTFIDPNPFCVSVSEKLLKNMRLLDNRMDQIIACETDVAESIDTGDVIMQLVEYYQNVAVALKQYTAKYNQLKRKAIQQKRHNNTEQIFKKITEKATLAAQKEMKAYEVVKDIQTLLERREQRLALQKNIEVQWSKI